MEPPSAEALLEFLYACPIGLMACDAAGDITLINPHAAQHLLPLAGDRDIGNLFTTFEQHAPELRHLVSAFAKPRGVVCDGHHIAVDLGNARQAVAPKILSCTVVKLGPDRLMVTLKDISAQVMQESRLREADAWFATLLDEVNSYAVVTLSKGGVVRTVNDAFASQIGLPCHLVAGRRLTEILEPMSSQADGCLDEQLEIAAREGWHLQEGWQDRASGDRYWCQRLVVAQFEADAKEVSGYSVVLRDVPRRGAGADELRRLLTSDHLTGVANRMHFSRMLDRGLQQWKSAGQELSLVMLDVDHFKRVNDTHGHPAGDILLREVAAIAAAHMPPKSTFARLGGEEFGAILPRCDLPQAVAIAEAMRQAIASAEVTIPGGTITVTASFGCATLTEAEGSTEALLALADQRLYAAKASGRNRVHATHPGRPAACLQGLRAPISHLS